MRSIYGALTIPVAALVLCAGNAAAASAGDGYRSQVARTARLSATLTYLETKDGFLRHYRDARVRIARVGDRSHEYSLRPLRPGYDVAPSFATPDKRAIHIRRLDARHGEPEVVVDLYWGGAHCCFYTVVFRYVSATKTYARSSHLWGDLAPAVRDLDSDGLAEFVTGDERFAYAFTSFADSEFPVQLWRFAGGRFRDVTRMFPAHVRAAADHHLAEYESRRSSDRSVRGILAAYLAEKCLLGEAEEGWAVLRRAAARGDLRHAYDGPETPAAYLAHLRRFLAKTGYTR
jgi:hypothetical protein